MAVNPSFVFTHVAAKVTHSPERSPPSRTTEPIAPGVIGASPAAELATATDAGASASPSPGSPPSERISRPGDASWPGAQPV
jgi:hypothetical protein